MKIGTYVIVRANEAGCFAGVLIAQDDSIRKVVLDNCRRLWYWKGAASLSQMAIDGVSKPKECKFPAPVNGHEVLGVIEIIQVTDVARASIEGVPAWRE
jgi:hypothetical protein